MSSHLSAFRIVADSAADLFSLERVPFCAAPLKVVTAEKEYPDLPGLDVAGMVEELKARILETFRKAEVRIHKTNGLCSFYAEKGGLLVGYETL